MGSGPSDFIGALLAMLSGVVVALFTNYLSGRRDAARERSLIANTRALLALEWRSNRNALAAFWQTVMALAQPAPAKDGAPAEPVKPGSAEELARLYDGGLLTYALPAWSSVRWNAIEPRTVAALSDSEISTLDGLYRTLRDITDLYSRLITVTPEDRAELEKNMHGRFWMNDLARDRQVFYDRLRAAVSRVIEAIDPLPGAIPTGA